jgi:AcrR family transcriptional regulator
VKKMSFDEGHSQGKLGGKGAVLLPARRTGGNGKKGRRPKGEEPSSEESTAAQILDAARRLLTRDGWEALSINAVCEEAGVYRTAISYHYGNKEGLAAAIFEDIIHELSTRVAGAVSTRPLGGQRVSATIRGFDTLGGQELQFAFLEVLTHLVRLEDYRARLSRLYEDTAAIVAVALGAHDEESRMALEPVSRAILAYLDGVFMQQLVDPDRDFEFEMEGFVAMVKPIVAIALKYEDETATGPNLPA